MVMLMIFSSFVESHREEAKLEDETYFFSEIK